MSRHDPMIAPVAAGADAQGLAYGATVLERLLLAIINAHPTPETEGRDHERLDVAMTALVGTRTSAGDDYDDALLFMARQRQRDVCDYEMSGLRRGADAGRSRIRSNMELAKLAAREVLGCTASDIRAIASRLCDMFSRQRSRTTEPDYVREVLETEAVKRLCDELAEWDIPTRL